MPFWFTSPVLIVYFVTNFIQRRQYHPTLLYVRTCIAAVPTVFRVRLYLYTHHLLYLSCPFYNGFAIPLGMCIAWGEQETNEARFREARRSRQQIVISSFVKELVFQELHGSVCLHRVVANAVKSLDACPLPYRFGRVWRPVQLELANATSFDRLYCRVAFCKLDAFLESAQSFMLVLLERQPIDCILSRL